jgi:hypothetical protein
MPFPRLLTPKCLFAVFFFEPFPRTPVFVCGISCFITAGRDVLERRLGKKGFMLFLFAVLVGIVGRYRVCVRVRVCGGVCVCVVTPRTLTRRPAISLPVPLRPTH